MKKILYILFILLLLFGDAYAACNWVGNSGTAENLTQVDVQECVTESSGLTGDVTINLPADTQTWVDPVVLNTSSGFANVTSITFQGAGVGSTIIIDNTSTTWGDDLFWVTIADNKRVIFDGMELQEAVGSHGETKIFLTGTAQDYQKFIIRNCKSTGSETLTARIENIYGLIHNFIGLNNTAQEFQILGDGDASFGRAVGAGGANAIFIEYSTFTCDPYPSVGVLDAQNGSRVVFRYNTVYQKGICSHGYHDTASYRGPLLMEFYNNTWDTEETVTHGLYSMRGGQWIIHDETITETGAGHWGPAGEIGGEMYYYGLCRGTCGGYDGEAVRCTSYPCIDQPGYVGTTQAPIYIWDNTFPVGFLGVPNAFGCNDGQNCATTPTADDTCTGGTNVWPCFIQENRDYYLSAMVGYAPYYYPHPLRDPIAPTIPSFTVDPSGAFVTIQGSEDLAVTTGAGYTMSSDGDAVTLAHTSISGTDIIQATSRTILSTETLTYSYTGTDTKDLSGNELAAITDEAVTNSSTQSGAVTGQTTHGVTGSTIHSDSGSTIYQ